MNSDTFTLMHGQEVEALTNQKISAEEAERAMGEAQEVKLRKKETSLKKRKVQKKKIITRKT